MHVYTVHVGYMPTKLALGRVPFTQNSSALLATKVEGAPLLCVCGFARVVRSSSGVPSVVLCSLVCIASRQVANPLA
jgi:hypothetical protein